MQTETRFTPDVEAPISHWDSLPPQATRTICSLSATRRRCTSSHSTSDTTSSREATWSPRVTASPLRTVHSATVFFSDPDLAGTYGTDVPERRTKHLRSDDLRDPASIPVGANTPA